MNLLSKYKPTNFKGYIASDQYYKGDGSDNGYFLGYDCYGIKKPYYKESNLVQLGANGTPNDTVTLIVGASSSSLQKLSSKWTHSMNNYYRLNDYNNYASSPKRNNITYSTQPFSVNWQGRNPNGGIELSATLRYSWDDTIHPDGKSATLGLKSILACDGVNTNAYLGCIAFRTQTVTPNLKKPLAPIFCAIIHRSPLGTTCSNTGEIITHNVYGLVHGVTEGTESSISNGHTKFYQGETNVAVIPFIAKWTGTTWCLIGLQTTPQYMTMSTTGGSGSVSNNVAITKIVAKISAFKDTSTGRVKFGFANDSDFTITVSGNGALAFTKNNSFGITPTDGNSTMINQSFVTLGKGIHEDTGYPYINVTNGSTYRASDIMNGRSSNATWQSPPMSEFTANTPFKIGIQVPYYKNLKTLTYLSGSVTVDPSNLQSSYTITINA